jgi:hypothetical protein
MPLPLKSLDQRLARRLKRGEIQPRPKVVAQYVNLLRAAGRLSRLLDQLLETHWRRRRAKVPTIFPAGIHHPIFEG